MNIIVDRRRAATPPTIYIRRGSKETLKVINPSPLKKLELDETSINAPIPIDSVQALAPLLTQLGRFVLPLQQPTGNTVPQDFGHFMSTHPPDSKSFTQIQEEQSQLLRMIGMDTAADSRTLGQLADGAHSPACASGPAPGRLQRRIRLESCIRHGLEGRVRIHRRT